MQFEKNVPVPTSRLNKYPFARLQPGESVLYPCSEFADRQRARKAAYRLAEHHQWQIIVRASLPEGVRVWREA